MHLNLARGAQISLSRRLRGTTRPCLFSSGSLAVTCVLCGCSCLSFACVIQACHVAQIDIAGNNRRRCQPSLHSFEVCANVAHKGLDAPMIDTTACTQSSKQTPRICRGAGREVSRLLRARLVQHLLPHTLMVPQRQYAVHIRS